MISFCFVEAPASFGLTPGCVSPEVANFIPQKQGGDGWYDSDKISRQLSFISLSYTSLSENAFHALTPFLLTNLFKSKGN